MRFAKSELIACLRQHDFEFKDETKRTEIWKKRGQTLRVNLPASKTVPKALVKIILKQAGLTPREIERFLHDAGGSD